MNISLQRMDSILGGTNSVQAKKIKERFALFANVWVTPVPNMCTWE